MQCRFQFFAERTLELKSRPQRPDERLEARIGGLVLHEALEHWQADLSQDFHTLFEQSFEAAIHKYGLPQGYRLEVERLQLGRIATKVGVKQRWNPVSTQVEVSLSVGFPGGITANGRVDRIDELGRGRCIIIDYKAGKVNNVLKLIDSQTSLQGPLYARAVRDALGLNTTAMIFWAIREDRTVGWGSVEGVDGLVPMPDHWADEAYGRAAERLADFLLGHIHAQPADEARCRWCDFVDTCRVEVRPSELVQIAGKSGG
jgi:RecB family exonuclease